MSELKPCPFCGEIPDFPHGLGTQYDMECGCGMAMSCVQICDLMTMPERQRPDAWIDENICYAAEFVERAKAEAIRMWNDRDVSPQEEKYRRALSEIWHLAASQPDLGPEQWFEDAQIIASEALQNSNPPPEHTKEKDGSLKGA